MNLRAVANRATSVVNPNISGELRACIGYASNAAYKRAPQYADAVPIIVQAQALSKKEIEHLDSLNLSNATRAVYANQQLTGVDREDQTGGDLLDFADPGNPKVNSWLVIAVLESWSGQWCKVAIGKQLRPAP